MESSSEVIGKKRKPAVPLDPEQSFASLIDQVNDDLQKTERQFTTRIKGIQELRQKIQTEVIAINERIAGLSDMFRSFTDEEQ